MTQSVSWSDGAFEATEFLFADYRDFVFPPHLHETFAIGVIQAGGQRFRPGRAPALVMPAGKLCAINPGVVITEGDLVVGIVSALDIARAAAIGAFDSEED